LSERSYHLVFDGKVSWRKNIHVIGWIALESHIEKVKGYVFMQAIEGASTIRQSMKGNKPSHKIVFRYGSQDGMIKVFLDHRRFIKENFKEK